MKRWVLVLVFAWSARAVADDVPPWSANVTAEQKATAQKRLEEGNTLFLARSYPEALEKYKAAVASWDHPAIRFNIVRCYIQIDRPVEASDNLVLALKYGAAPLDEAVYSEALSYQKLLANQIGDLEVTCDQPDAKITLDGQPLLVCPGRASRRLAPGAHQLVGTKAGHVPKTTDVFVTGGKPQRVEVRLDTLEKAAKIVHRWPAWMPWVVFGGGLAISGVGGLLELQAMQNMDAYDRSIDRNCRVARCDESTVDIALRDDAKRESAIGIGVILAGAATTATGAVLLYLNRGRTEYENPVQITPQTGGASVWIRGRF